MEVNNSKVQDHSRGVNIAVSSGGGRAGQHGGYGARRAALPVL